MLLTAKNYYEDTQLSDFNLLCTYGITQEDVEDLEQQSFVSQVQPSYYCDVFPTMNHRKTAANRWCGSILTAPATP